MGLSATMPKQQRNDVSVKIDAEVYRMVKTVAAWKGVPIAEYLTEVVGPVARRDMGKMNQEIKRPREDGAARQG